MDASKIAGKYDHVNSEHLDDYFKAIGVPFIPRKMMCATKPSIEISISKDGKYTINTSTLLRTTSYKFALGEEYEEHMPGNVLKCTATIDGDNLVILCVAPNGEETTRTYSFKDDELIIIYKHKASQTEAKRYFKKDPSYKPSVASE